MYQSTKTFTPGYSCAFRQWRAESHCRFIHGYALEIKLVFGAETLDVNNWVVDFGGFKKLKDTFELQFDHTTIMAADDPLIQLFLDMKEAGLITLRTMPAVGCEAFAQWVYWTTIEWLNAEGLAERVWLVSAEVREHVGNSALVVSDTIRIDKVKFPT
jgi:6-pyruvoyltetrahydropterin/6-carboxytetrahydropterin synthase